MLRRIHFAIVALQWVSCRAGSSAEAADTWRPVVAGSHVPSARQGASAALDPQQRMWIFAGKYLNGGWFVSNDLHYFDVEARTWHQVDTTSAPQMRYKHTAAFDSKQRMWIFGGWDSNDDFRNDLHYFDMEARTWREVDARNAPSKRSDHTAVFDSKQRMWIFGGHTGEHCGRICYGGDTSNDLHYFDIEAWTWHKVDASNAPSKREAHTAILDSKQRMWVFGGYSDSQGGAEYNDLYYFDFEAKTWHKVEATDVPAGRRGHTAVLDSQQRMWIFGGYSSSDSSSDGLRYFDVEARSWHKVDARNAPSKRIAHTAILDSKQRMWVFGGYDSGLCLNDLHYIQVAPDSSISTSPLTPATTTWVSTSPPTTITTNSRSATITTSRSTTLTTTSRSITVTSSSTTSKVDCSTSACPDGHVRKNQSQTGDAGGCCVVSCQLFTCPRFHILKEFAGKIAGRSYDVCCDRSCEIFPCPWGYMRKAGAKELKGSTYEECCDETCRMFQCPAGYMPKTQQNFQILGSLDNCCDQTLTATRTSTSSATLFATISEAPSSNQSVGDVEAADTWRAVAAGSHAPSERGGASAALDAATQRMWVFAGRHYSLESVYFNDLHYFDVEARTWHKVEASNAPSKRYFHSAVFDSKQRMWIFGGEYGHRNHDIQNDLHYFDVEARTWHEVEASFAPAARGSHTAVLDSKQRMWIFGGRTSNGATNELHYFDVEANRQARTWREVYARNAPAVRYSHTAVLDSQQRMWVFGGYVCCRGTRLNDLYYFDVEAKTWHKVEATDVPRGRNGHTAVLDSQQRMWIFGGWESLDDADADSGDLRYLDVEAKTWHKASFADPPSWRAGHTAVLDAKQRMWVFGGWLIFAGDKDYLNDLHYLQVGSLKNFTNFTQGTGKDDPPPSKSSNLLVPVLVPLLLACLAAGFSIFCFWAKKLRGCQAQAELGPVLPLSSDPRAMFPLPASSLIRPLIFAWESRMTAEWPRGKVLKLEVGEHGFEAGGQRYQFSDGPKSFSWADGTVQEVESIQGNVVHWVSQHPRPEWRRFRWICTPQCAADGLHDMEVAEVTSSEAYRCKSCSYSRAAESHWCCPVHKEHLCPVCAELPPKAPTLGVAANFLTDIFPPMARGATSSENPNFYEMCSLIAHGDQGLGFGKRCPRDGQLNCSIVDALEDAQSGKVTHFVSWCWAYRLNDVVTALSRWLRTSGGDPAYVFLWMCFFCNNQYRILQEETKTGSEDLKGIFEKHLAAAGRMLVLLDDIRNPTYVSRAWCIFESYVCIQQKFSMEILLPSSAQTFFREAVCSGAGGGMEELTRAISSLDVRDAKASQRADEDLIKRLILTDIGFDAVNQAVRDRLVDELLSLFREILVPRPR